MELVKKNQLYAKEVITAQDELATDADMKSLVGFYDNMFHNVALRQDVLRRAGFSLFVKPEFALNFKYAASIYNRMHHTMHAHPGIVYDADESDHCKFINKGHRVYYTGHLPLNVLNKVRIAVGMGTDYITIHSNDKSLLEHTTRKDPVIVGWHGFGRLYDYLICNNQANKKPRWLCECKPGRDLDNPFGFIIAIFGGGEVI